MNTDPSNEEAQAPTPDISTEAVVDGRRLSKAQLEAALRVLARVRTGIRILTGEQTTSEGAAGETG